MSFPIELYRNANVREMLPRIPQPSHRHAAPYAPWPFLDLDSKIDPDLLANPRRQPTAEQQHWSKYPQSLYPNWTPAQQMKSGITKIVERVREDCTIHAVHVHETGIFSRQEDVVVTEDNREEYWKKLHEDLPADVRVRALFVDNLSGPVLQMLGTNFNVEPFFFSSSFNWIPARYQEVAGEGDHITLTLPFIRCSMPNPPAMPSSRSSYVPMVPILQSADQVTDIHAPLVLFSNHVLLPDILAVHMVRSPGLSTIISYHPPHTHRTTAAHTLQTRLLAAGQSVYWNKILNSTISSDPTFVLLVLLWYPFYAFDESLEALYLHICSLETRVMATTDMTMASTDITLTQQLHVVQARLLHYQSLLEDFRKSVLFIAETQNPMLEHVNDLSAEMIVFVKDKISKESTNLLNEIARLEQSRSMQEKRLRNAMEPGAFFARVYTPASVNFEQAFSSVNLEDSKAMKELTQAAVRDSAAMKQISYLTMFFLPASFVATAFGMNINVLVKESRGTLAHYAAFALPLTAITIWIIIGFPYRKKDRILPTHDNSLVPMKPKLPWLFSKLRGNFKRNSAPV
ncbi:hypothetical protein MVEN_00219900 [Mycena venus]|uniref:Uncharacterized protein n=1 Tax=Mycena venus TaxID=2733690 RepID=A0A8H7DDG6_9AGAR|nr:hypothetical protein MVEN_00219900 [Mycena venus]